MVPRGRVRASDQGVLHQLVTGLKTVCVALTTWPMLQISPGPTSVGVLCDCQHLFCFECGQEAHAPATCGMLVAWKGKAKDGSETTNWYHSQSFFIYECPFGCVCLLRSSVLTRVLHSP
jgi:ariadne-1